MAEGKGTALARRSGPAPRVVAPRNKVNIALPLSMIRAEEPVTMRAGDWISLAGLAVSVIGFSVVIRRTPSASPARRKRTRRAAEQAKLTPVRHSPSEQPCDALEPSWRPGSTPDTRTCCYYSCLLTLWRNRDGTGRSGPRVGLYVAVCGRPSWLNPESGWRPVTCHAVVMP